MQNTPNIRFKGFTDPWEQRKLREIIDSAYQGINTTADKVQYELDGVPVLQAKHITSGEVSFDDVRYLDKEKYSHYFPKYSPQKGELLFANIGTIGPSIVVNSSDEFLIAWNILKISTNDKSDSYYLHLVFDRLWQSGVFNGLQRGNATKFINKDSMLNLDIPVPTLKEQEIVGRFFSNLDNLITLHQRKCDILKDIKKYMLQNMFPTERRS